MGFNGNAFLFCVALLVPLFVCGQQHDRKELLACCLLGRGLNSQPCPKDACKWICGTDGCTVEKLIKTKPSGATGGRSSAGSISAATFSRPAALPGFGSFQQPTASAFSVPALGVSQWGFPQSQAFHAQAAAVSPVTPAPLVDRHQYCCFWAKQNKCGAADTKTFMDNMCAASCNNAKCNQKTTQQAPIPQQQQQQPAVQQSAAQDLSRGATEAQIQQFQQLQLTNYRDQLNKNIAQQNAQKAAQFSSRFSAKTTQNFGLPQKSQAAFQFPQPQPQPGVGQVQADAAPQPQPAVVQPQLPDTQLKQFCCYWASQKQCSENPAWMLVHCKEDCEDPSCASTDGNPAGFDPTGQAQRKLYAQVKKAQDAAATFTQALNNKVGTTKNAATRAESDEVYEGAQNLLQQQQADFFNQNPAYAQQYQQQLLQYRQQYPLTALQQSVVNQPALTAQQQQEQLTPDQNAAVQQQQDYIKQLQEQSRAALELAQKDPVAFAAQYRAQQAAEAAQGQPQPAAAAVAYPQETQRAVAGAALPPHLAARPPQLAARPPQLAAGAAVAAAPADALTASQSQSQAQQYYYPQAQQQYQPQAYYQQTQYSPYLSKKSKKA